MIDASVTIDFDADFTSQANGFSIQPNGYSAVGDLGAADSCVRDARQPRAGGAARELDQH